MSVEFDFFVHLLYVQPLSNKYGPLVGFGELMLYTKNPKPTAKMGAFTFANTYAWVSADIFYH